MSNRHWEIIRARSRSLDPIPTETRPVLRELSGIRACIFDVYGTLLISASGDIDAHAETDKAQAFIAALAAADLHLELDGQEGVEALLQAIQTAHSQARDQGIEYPEVDIREIWRELYRRWRSEGRIAEPLDEETIERIALEYELRVNPVWPMPNALACLQALGENGIRLGLVSNAQFYTPDVLGGLLGRNLTDLGFPHPLRFYSFEHRQAKPGTHLYERAAKALQAAQIEPAAILYIGNDMLKDVLPAQRVGFQTALFAGDARSLRLRKQDPRTESLEPDLVITNLLDLVRCLPSRQDGRMP